jgi:hypothetical protein
MYHQRFSELNHIHYLLSAARNSLASASARQVPLSSLPRFHSLPTCVLIHVMMLYMHIYYCALRGLHAARFGELRVPGDLAHFVAVACALFSIE